MGRRIRRITVTAVGTPPRLPLRPLVDEVQRAMEHHQRSADAAVGGERPSPGVDEGTRGQRRARPEHASDPGIEPC